MKNSADTKFQWQKFSVYWAIIVCTSFHETIYKGTNTCDFWLLKVGQLGVGGGEPCSDCYACFPKSSSFRFAFSFLQFQFHYHIINTIIPEGKGQEKELWLLPYCNNLESYLDCQAIFTISLGFILIRPRNPKHVRPLGPWTQFSIHY